MKTYYEDARLTVTENNGRYSIFDGKYARETHKNASKGFIDDFLNRVKSKRRKGRVHGKTSI